jgi:hypothetical protein
VAGLMESKVSLWLSHSPPMNIPDGFRVANVLVTSIVVSVIVTLLTVKRLRSERRGPGKNRR